MSRTNTEIRRDKMFTYDQEQDAYQCQYCRVWQDGEELAERDWYCIACSEESDNPMW